MLVSLSVYNRNPSIKGSLKPSCSPQYKCLLSKWSLNNTGFGLKVGDFYSFSK